MLRLTLVIAALFVGAFLLPSSVRSPAADEKPQSLPGNEFANKFVAVNFKTGGSFRSSILQDVTVRRLGGRDFLVGEYSGKDGGPEEWKGAVLWIPLESVDTLTVFTDKAKAWAFADLVGKDAEKK